MMITRQVRHDTISSQGKREFLLDHDLGSEYSRCDYRLNALAAAS